MKTFALRLVAWIAVILSAVVLVPTVAAAVTLFLAAFLVAALGGILVVPLAMLLGLLWEALESKPKLQVLDRDAA